MGVSSNKGKDNSPKKIKKKIITRSWACRKMPHKLKSRKLSKSWQSSTIQIRIWMTQRKRRRILLKSLMLMRYCMMKIKEELMISLALKVFGNKNKAVVEGAEWIWTIFSHRCSVEEEDDEVVVVKISNSIWVEVLEVTTNNESLNTKTSSKTQT